MEIWIERASEPIAGRLTQPGGENVAFAGWVELSAAIEATRCGSDLRGQAPSREVLAHLQISC
jgi:hypothetical protein